MKINFLILLMPAILFLNNCAIIHRMELTAVASPDQKTDPYGAVVSEKKHMVSMSPYKEIDYMRNNAIFSIIIENRGEAALTISNENISVIFEGHDKKRTVKKLDVLSAKKFMNDVEYEYRKRTIHQILEQARDRPSNYYISVPTEDGKTVKFYTSFSTPYNALSFAVSSDYDKLKVLRETLPDLALNLKTIMPHNSIIVLISCRTNKIPRKIEGDFKISVSIDGEEHRFTFARK